MSARDAMLARIQASLRSGLFPGASPSIPPRSIAAPPTDFTVLVESFTRELSAVGGDAYSPATQAEALGLLMGLLREHGGDELLAWPDAELSLPGVDEALQHVGLRRIQVSIARDAATRTEQVAELDRPQVGLTGALAGLADTGTLALLSGTTRARVASLLPPVHVALLPVRALFPTMAAFFAAYAPATLTQNASNLVFIAGPSRTADIEMVITRGVHGPKALHVVLVPEV
jgi:L-lactate dehydrogenase complex protein LldG